MDTKIFNLVLFACLIFTGCCQEDTFGDHVNWIVPVRTSPIQDTMLVGDTISIHINIAKDVQVDGSGETMYLENFNFFSEFTFNEISDTPQVAYPDLQIMEDIGSLSVLQLNTALVYPITFEESEFKYEARFRVIVPSKGLFSLGFNTDPGLFESYDHAATYSCGKNKRTKMQVYYRNDASSQANYQDVFRKTKLWYLLELVDFENYRNGGTYAFYAI